MQHSEVHRNGALFVTSFLIFILMEINFHEQYKNYSTADLLKITLKPEEYQPAAVAAAAEILQSREVTQFDMEEANELQQDIVDLNKIKSLQTINYKNWAEMPDKWVYIILVVSVVEYLRMLYTDLSSMDAVLHNEYYPFRMVMILSYLDLIYLPIAFFMFYKRMRWGWILIFVTKLFTIIPTLIYYFKEYLPIPHAPLFPSFILMLFLNFAMLAVLWKPEVTNIFKISNKTKWLTALVTLLLVLLGSLPRLLG